MPSRRSMLQDKVPEVGDFYGGGVVFYIFQSGDLGYVEGETHGIICSITDQSSGIQWRNGSSITTGATATAIGIGGNNTALIITKQGAGTYAATVCTTYNGGGYNNWVLPSKNELAQMYVNRATINDTAVANGGVDFSSANYWGSTEQSQYVSFQQNFVDGSVTYGNKANANRVRAVRYF